MFLRSLPVRNHSLISDKQASFLTNKQFFLQASSLFYEQTDLLCGGFVDKQAAF
jgi:hypothetical protein